MIEELNIMEVVIDVKGMTCGNCEKAVKGALSNLDGVENVAIDLKAGKVDVAYNNEVVSLEAICEEIEDIGYDIIK